MVEAADGPPSEQVAMSSPSPAPFDRSKLVRETGAYLSTMLGVFRKFDGSGDGEISSKELQTALSKLCGRALSDLEARRFIHDVDEDLNQTMNFGEFYAVSKRMHTATAPVKTDRIPRAYMTSEEFDHYSGIFQSRCGDDGMLSASELKEFLTKNGVNTSSERVVAIMTEVDSDASGTLDENEFFVMLIKSIGLKKRKIGPGLCSVEELQKEGGWSLSDLKAIGYDCKELYEARYAVAELMPEFKPGDMRRGGIPLSVLIDHGWDCAEARQEGFELQELFSCQCSMQRIFSAGWNDVASAAQLRKLGVDGRQMKAGGWGVSQLRLAGYSSADLRLAGYSRQAVSCLEHMLARRANLDPGERRCTRDLRKEADRLVDAANAGTGSGVDDAAVAPATSVGAANSGGGGEGKG
eukprot:TRINITY_DN55651_c0_g1_i1.p1 TRINITY_DN55651_c0_g1~~TRINITY_DN55651_c0_g1_i1.p1  ORF type:complete len:448 (-),score=88.93 TRINITY_DN55651_c0_g1_i1:112-1341(-)